MAHMVINKILFHPDNVGYDKDIVVDHATDAKHSVPYILHSQDNATKYIVFAHGNACNIYTSSHFCQQISKLNNINVIVFEYPGYSVCEGKASEQGCYKNLNTMVTHMIENLKINTKDIYLVGQSLGTGIVADYVARNEWSTPIMLISPYTTITSVVIGSNNIFVRAFKRCIDMFETIHKVKKITCPVKIVHGKQDTLISIEHGKALYEKLNNKMEPVWVNGADHNNISSNIAHDKGMWDSFLVDVEEQ